MSRNLQPFKQVIQFTETFRKRTQDIKPFVESPSEEAYQKISAGSAKIPASDLFSIFTANIILEETLFTR